MLVISRPFLTDCWLDFSGFCTTFTTLCIARGLVGLGTAGFYPVSESMIADFFEPEQRGAYSGEGIVPSNEAWTWG